MSLALQRLCALRREIAYLAIYERSSLADIAACLYKEECVWKAEEERTCGKEAHVDCADEKASAAEKKAVVQQNPVLDDTVEEKAAAKQEAQVDQDVDREAPVEQEAEKEAPVKQKPPVEQEAEVEQQAAAEDAPVEQEEEVDQQAPVEQDAEANQQAPMEQDAEVEQEAPADRDAPVDQQASLNEQIAVAENDGKESSKEQATADKVARRNMALAASNEKSKKTDRTTRAGRKKRKVTRFGEIEFLSSQKKPKASADYAKPAHKINEKQKQDGSTAANADYPKECEYGCGKMLATKRSRPYHKRFCAIAKKAKKAAQEKREQQQKEEEQQQPVPSDDNAHVEQESQEASKSRSAKNRALDAIANVAHGDDKSTEDGEQYDDLDQDDKISIESRSFATSASRVATLLADSIRRQDDAETVSQSSDDEMVPRAYIDQETGAKQLEYPSKSHVQ